MKTTAFPRAGTSERGAGKAVQVSMGRASARSRYGSTKRVLVVDDSLSIRQLFQTVLESWGYSVVTAASGPEALRQLDMARFHGMLLDYSMPGGMTGIDVLRRVHLYDPALPVVMITATHEIMGQALAGAKTCLLKPVELSELQQVVHHCFEKAATAEACARRKVRPDRNGIDSVSCLATGTQADSYSHGSAHEKSQRAGPPLDEKPARRAP